MRQAFDAIIDTQKIISEPQRFRQKHGIILVSVDREEDEIGGQPEG